MAKSWRHAFFVFTSLGNAASAPPLVVGIAGGSGCGKTTLAHKIVELVGPEVAVLSLDEYYKTLSEDDHRLAGDGAFNFDRPEALDLDQLAKDLLRMKALDAQWPIMLPSYDFVTHRCLNASVALQRPRAVLVEGLFVLAVPEVTQHLDVRLFVQDDIDTCLVQRLRRDVAERGIGVGAALAQYERYVKPAYDEIIKPSSSHADLIVPNGTRNQRAAELVAGWVLNRTLQTDLRGSCGSDGFNACGVLGSVVD